MDSARAFEMNPRLTRIVDCPGRASGSMRSHPGFPSSTRGPRRIGGPVNVPDTETRRKENSGSASRLCQWEIQKPPGDRRAEREHILDLRRERDGRLCEVRLHLVYEGNFPSEALELPDAERCGEDGDTDQEDGGWAWAGDRARLVASRSEW